MNKKVFIFLIIFLGLAFFGNANFVFAGTNLRVILEPDRLPPDPLFSEADFKPGDCVTRWVKLTNNTSINQIIGASITNYSDSGHMGDVFNVEIKEHDSGIVKFTGTMTDFSKAGEVILNSDARSGIEFQYDVKVCFQIDAGNPYQEKSLSFDISFSIQGPSESPTPTPCVTDCGGTGGDSDGGGGSTTGGGSYFLATSTSTPLPTPVGGVESAPGEVLGETTQKLPGTGLPPGILLLISPFAILPFLRKSR